MVGGQILTKGAQLNKASSALILLHGRGGSASDILRLSDRFCGDNFYVAAPQAPDRSWYPCSFMADERENEPWLSSAVRTVQSLIEETAAHIPKSRLYLMGFSQGACLCLEVASRFPAKYGGVAAFTGGLIGKTLNTEKYQGDFGGTKVFIGISDKDPHVPLSRAEQSRDVLVRLGADVTLQVYPRMGHIISEEEIRWVQDHIFGL